MNHSPAFRRMLAPVLALALVCTLSLPASAFFWNKKTDLPSVSDFSKNGMVGQVISFSAEDFPVSGGSGGTALAAITLKTLPDIGTGMLTVGGQPLTEGALVDASALIAFLVCLLAMAVIMSNILFVTWVIHTASISSSVIISRPSV